MAIVNNGRVISGLTRLEGAFCNGLEASSIYRVIFWRPRPGIDVWLPAAQPLGEAIRREVLGGHRSELLGSILATEMFERLHEAFNESRIDEDGYLHWTDSLENGFVARRGEQFVEVCCFDLADEDFEKLFSVANSIPCEHYDWGS